MEPRLLYQEQHCQRDDAGGQADIAAAGHHPAGKHDECGHFRRGVDITPAAGNVRDDYQRRGAGKQCRRKRDGAERRQHAGEAAKQTQQRKGAEPAKACPCPVGVTRPLPLDADGRTTQSAHQQKVYNVARHGCVVLSTAARAMLLAVRQFVMTTVARPRASQGRSGLRMFGYVA